MYIDFTGGTKAMSTAAAMAGSVINIQMLYCGSNEYMPDFRKPYPGSERIHLISNPMSVFGDLEVNKAYTLFEEYNYAGACEKLDVLRETVPDPVKRQELSNVYMLAKAYEHWDALEFNLSYDCMAKLNKSIDRDIKNSKHILFGNQIIVLRRQEQILWQLNKLYGW